VDPNHKALNMALIRSYASMDNKEYTQIIKELARIINEKLDIPLINEETEQLLFEFIINLAFNLLISNKGSRPIAK
jgi:hypothetical protein